VDARGYYSTAYVGDIHNPSNNALTNVGISQYYALAGPSYRFYVQPKLSVAGRVLGGMAYGKFSDNLGSFKSEPKAFGLWPDGYTFAFSAGIPVEYSVTPNLAVRLAPEYFFSGFGSTIQHSRGLTSGVVYRFGKQ